MFGKIVKASAEVRVYNCIAVWLLFGCVIQMWFGVVVCVCVYVCLNQSRVYLYMILLLHSMV